MKSIDEGRSAAIRRCSQLEVTKKTRKKKVCGLEWLPDELVLNCLAHLSRFDLAAFSMASKAHRSLVNSPQLWDLRCKMGSTNACLYVCLHIFREPSPRWLILHPVQRRLKPIYSRLSQPPGSSSSSFVVMDWGIYVIGGLINGKPTSNVKFFDCFEHKWYRFPPMKRARASASAFLIGNKIYVFGGCGDDADADSSNWAEVYDILTRTWDFLFVPTPMKIQQSVVIDDKEEVYAVGEDGQSFSFSPSKPIFVSSGNTDSKPGFRDDWCFVKGRLFCRGTGGKILWCLRDDLDWKEVKGLEALQDILSGWKRGWFLPHMVKYDISKLSTNSAGNLVIFWQTQPWVDRFELCSAEISLLPSEVDNVCDVWGTIEWSGSVYELGFHVDLSRVKVLFAGSLYV